MSHEDEYHDNMVIMLELIWGKGYMAPGGSGNVARMLRGIETRDKRILDIGCGIGGPAFEMAGTHGAQVTGIDLEAPLVERAVRAAEDVGLSDRCSFHTVESGPLSFGDETFDIVTTSGAITQSANKDQVFSEAFRVLKPGGYLTSYEWMTSGDPYSEDMYYWFEKEGLTYALETLDGYARVFANAGFTDVETEDATDWYRAEARREYDLMRGDLYPRMVEAMGQKDADHFVENWRAMVVVIDKGEMRQGYCRGRKPV